MNDNTVRDVARILLGAGLIVAGISHLTVARRAFQAQVPDWVPLKKDDTVVYSGVAEVALGAALAISRPKQHRLIGNIAAAFFVAVFPGNIAQFRNRRNAFGLDTDAKRGIRLLFQPALVYWALKSTRRSK